MRKSSTDAIEELFMTASPPKEDGTPSEFRIVPGTLWQELMDVIQGDSGEKWEEIWMESDMIRKIREYKGIFVNDAFIPLWNKTRGIQFLYGGYGSSKTTFAITRQLVKSMENKYHRCLYGRQKKTEARNLHSNIITEIKRNGWQDRFDYSEAPNGTPEIVCIATGNKFQLFGCDDIDSLKGVDNPTDILLDEVNQVSFKHFGMLLTRLRGSGRETLFVGMFNNCDVYPDHWLAKYIFGNENPEKKSEQVLVDALRKQKTVKHHSVYTDNKFQNPFDYEMKLIIQAGGDADLIEAYCKGAWGVKLNQQPFYKQFDEKKIVGPIVINGFENYNPALPIHISFDENVNPYFPAIVSQIDGKRLYVIEEIAARSPNNTITWIGEYLVNKYFNELGHRSGCFVYGDATSEKEDVKLEKGSNFFTLLLTALERLQPQLRKQDANPSVKMRRDFINLIFGRNYGGIEVFISDKCEELKNDLKHTQEDPAGKGKYKNKEKVDGIAGVQRYGHFSDAFDYLICEAFMYEYLQFQNGVVSFPVVGGGRVVNNSLDAAEKQMNRVEVDDEIEGSKYKRGYRHVKRQSRHGYV